MGTSRQTTLDFAVTPRRQTATPWFADIPLLLTVLLLVTCSLVMVYSTTGVLAAERFGDQLFFAKRQLIGVILGTTLLIGVLLLPFGYLRAFAPYCLPLSCLLLLLPLVPGLSDGAGGADRWIALGPFKFQPGEFVKILVVVGLASFFARREHEVTTFFGGMVKPVLLLVPIAILFLLQPDFGSTVVVVTVAVIMAASSGTKLRYVAAGGAVLATALLVLAFVSPYRMQRITSFVDPFADASGKGYQLVQSLVAVGSGGFWGVGLGEGQQKLFFLPAAHTDFLFAVIAEELGFVGAVSVLALFGVLIVRGVSIAMVAAHDTFAFTIAVGITALFMVQVAFNVGVVIGLLPTKGMVLPLLGYGGSAMMAALLAVGLLLNVARANLSGRFH